MGAGSERNVLCWCGSGKKYKKCHLDREEQAPLSIQDILESHAEAFGSELCLHPAASPGTCKGSIVKAHTIQRAGGLAAIARNGLVYSTMPDLPSLIKNEGRLVARPVGINKASTFTGFCSYHDTVLFRPLETVTFVATPEQCFLLGFRAVSKELFSKQGAFNQLDKVRQTDRGRPIESQLAMQDLISAYVAGTTDGLNDLKRLKGRYDSAFLHNDYSAFRYYALMIDRLPEFMCSGGTHPLMDFSGRVLQSLRLGTEPQNITVSIIGRDGQGAVVFSWLADSAAAEALVRSLNVLPEEAVSAAISRFAFQSFENVLISPDWWDKLPEATRQSLLDRAISGAPHLPPLPANALMDDGHRPVQWKILRRISNVPGL